MKQIYLIILYLYTFNCTCQVESMKADTSKINTKISILSNPISLDLLPQEGIEFKRNTSLQTTSVTETEYLEKKKDIGFQSEDGIESKKSSALPIKTSTKIIHPDKKQLLVKPK